jgi:hypothetical protein
MGKKLRRSDLITTKSLPDGHAVLVSKKTNWASTITPLAALAWEFCDGENTIEQIVEKIKSIPELQLQSDLRDEVSSLLEDLVEAGFLEEDCGEEAGDR